MVFFFYDIFKILNKVLDILWIIDVFFDYWKGNIFIFIVNSKYKYINFCDLFNDNK